MILPTKHIRANHALIGVGALLLQYLNRPQTVSGLWEQVKDFPSMGSYERFILGLDMLHIIGTVEISDGMLERMV